MNIDDQIPASELVGLVPKVSDADKANLIAYAQARRRIKRGTYNYTAEQRSSDEFIMFTLGRNAKRTNRLILKAFLEDMLQTSDLIILANHCHNWQIISYDMALTKRKINLWTNYFNVAKSVYATIEDNVHANNSMINLNFYQMDDFAMLESNAGWYGKNGKAINAMPDKIRAAYNLGYLLSKRRTPSIVRPKAANRQDIEFLAKLITFYDTNNGAGGGSGLRSDLRNTIRRFTSNYMWPNKQVLDAVIKV